MNKRTKFILIVIAGIIGIGLISSIFFNALPKLNDLIRAHLIRLSAVVLAQCSVTSLAGEEITEETPSTTNTVPTFAGFANIRQGNLTFEIDDGLITGTSKADSQGYWSWSPSRALSRRVHTLYITAQHPNNSSVRATCTLTFRVVGPGADSGPSAIIPLPSEEIPEEEAPTTITGTVTISPTAGGSTTVTNVDGGTAAVSFPANAVSVSTKIIITPVSKTTISSTHPFPGVMVAGNWVYSFIALVADRLISQFKQAVTLTFTYTDADADADVQVAGLNESSLKIYYWEISSKQWIALPDSTVNTATNTITATITRFSLFAVMGSPVFPAENPADLNGDKKVDLLDFGLLLFNWGIPSNPEADLNKDGVADLADLAMMLYWWTG